MKKYRAQHFPSVIASLDSAKKSITSAFNVDKDACFADNIQLLPYGSNVEEDLMRQLDSLMANAAWQLSCHLRSIDE